MRSPLLFAALSLLFAAAPGCAQAPQPAPPEQPLVRVNVDLVQFDVIVTDAKGTHVAGLKPEDFEVLEGGKPQRISNFTFIQGARPVTAVDVSSQPAPTIAAARAKPEEIARTIAVVIDDLGLSEQSFSSMRQALQSFVNNQVQPGDLVAIVTTTGKLGSLERVTADKRALRAALARLRSAANHRESVLDAEFGSPCFENDVTTDYYGRLSVAAFRRIVDSLRELPGRKSMLLFSEGIPVRRLPATSAEGAACIANNRGVPNQILGAEYDAFVLHAMRSGVTVNTIDPRGLIATFETAEAQTISMANSGARQQELVTSQGNLADMARRTGGVTVANENDLSAAVARVMNEEDGYYLIGYKPSQPAPKEKGGFPSLRNIAVRVNRPGVKVRFHTSLYADEPKQPGTPAQRLAAAALSPFARPGIHVRSASHFWDIGDARGVILDTTLHIDARDLAFTTESDGRHTAIFEVLAVIFGPEVKPLDTFEKTYTVSLTDEVYHKALANGLVQQLQMPLKRAGAHQFRAAVRDRGSDRIGSAGELIEVPELKHGALALSGIVLQHADSHGVSTQTHSVTRFHRGETIAYACQVLNARPGNVEVRATLRRDSAELGTVELASIDATHQTDPKRIVVKNHYRLGEQFTPGEYTLQVTALENRGRSKPGTVSQSVEFEVIE